MKKNIPLFLILAVIVIFFRQFFLHGLLPIPSDTLVGLYHPFRDFYAKDYPRGIPFKNFLITDPIRQLYPWKELAVSLEKNFTLPLWNPYNFTGYPLLGNFQTAAFYPLNIFFFFLPFSFAWSLSIFLQPLLAGVFLYLYLRSLKLHPMSSFLGGIAFALCGFSMAWMEWNTVVQTLMWLPLLLLSIDKILFYLSKNNFKFFVWCLVLLCGLSFSFFAGHLQTFFYIFLVQFVYSTLKLFQLKPKIRLVLIFAIIYVAFFVLTAIQWIPTLQFILLSARNVDINYLTTEGWFVPWQNLVQFLAPDFFGNPTTLNYWGIWNYGEFVGYIGLLPLIFAFFALVSRHDKKTYFFGIILFVAFIFAFSTPLGKLPYLLNIPLLSTSQPTRLIGIIDFALCVLAALGFDYLLNVRQKRIILFSTTSFLGIIFLILWIFVLKIHPVNVSVVNLSVAKHNLIFPTAMYATIALLLIFIMFLKQGMPRKVQLLLFGVLLLITIADQLRFADKFTPFVTFKYLYPSTTSIKFLQDNLHNNRLMTTDSRILPPNVSTIYRLQSIEGYDPLYIERYGAFIAAMQRNKPDISSPFGFNRIIIPHDSTSPFINLLGVKYILSFDQLQQKGIKKVYQEGQTKIYENINVLPRAFFATDVVGASDGQDAINKIFKYKNDLKNIAVVENAPKNEIFDKGIIKINRYSENSISIQTENTGEGFLVLTDVYYPTWHAKIDGKETVIYRTDFTFRGILVPRGTHKVEFFNSLF